MYRFGPSVQWEHMQCRKCLFTLTRYVLRITIFLILFLSWFYILYKACVIIAYTLYSLFLCSKITKLETLSIFVKAYQPLLSHLQARENIHQVAFAKECWSKISKKYHWFGESVELIWLNFLNKSGIVCHWRKTKDWLSFIFFAFLCLSWKHTQ